MEQYVPLVLMLAVAVGLGAILVTVSTLFGPKRPNAAKSSPYECGVEPVGSARTRFPVRYYLIALVFVIFDLEAVFIYPWAASFVDLRSAGLGWLAFWEMVVFMSVLFVGWFYLLKRGALDWE